MLKVHVQQRRKQYNRGNDYSIQMVEKGFHTPKEHKTVVILPL